MNRFANVLGVSAALVMLLLAPAAVEAADAGGRSSDVDGEEAAVQQSKSVDRYMPVDIFGGQVLYNEETKQLKAPTPEQAAALSAALKARYGRIEARTTSDAPVVAKNSSGAFVAQLDGSQLNFSVARVQPDGTLGVDCTKDHDHAADSATTPVAGAETE